VLPLSAVVFPLRHRPRRHADRRPGERCHRARYHGGPGERLCGAPPVQWLNPCSGCLHNRGARDDRGWPRGPRLRRPAAPRGSHRPMEVTSAHEAPGAGFPLRGRPRSTSRRRTIQTPLGPRYRRSSRLRARRRRTISFLRSPLARVWTCWFITVFASSSEPNPGHGKTLVVTTVLAGSARARCHLTSGSGSTALGAQCGDRRVLTSACTSRGAAIGCLRAGTAGRLGVIFPDRAAAPQVMRRR
jgi:hypothetical protein